MVVERVTMGKRGEKTSEPSGEPNIAMTKGTIMGCEQKWKFPGDSGFDGVVPAYVAGEIGGGGGSV